MEILPSAEVIRLIRLFLAGGGDGIFADDALGKLVGHWFEKMRWTVKARSFNERHPGLGEFTPGLVAEILLRKDNDLLKHAKMAQSADFYVMTEIGRELGRRMYAESDSPWPRFRQKFLKALKDLKDKGFIEREGNERIRRIAGHDSSNFVCVGKTGEPTPSQISEAVMATLPEQEWRNVQTLYETLSVQFTIAGLQTKVVEIDDAAAGGAPALATAPAMGGVSDADTLALEFDRAVKDWSDGVAGHGRKGRVTNYEVFAEFWLWRKDPGALKGKDYAQREGLPESEITRRCQELTKFFTTFCQDRALSRDEMLSVLAGAHALHQRHNPNSKGNGPSYIP